MQDAFWIAAQLVEGLNLNPQWLGPLIGLIGLLLAYAYYRRSRIGARMVYQRRGLHLIGRAQQALPDEVEISFKGLKVPRLTSTHVVMWNAGRATIRQNDVVSADPVRFIFSEGAEVLRVRTVSVTRPTIAFEASRRANTVNEVLCTFDYLDPGDGAVVEILHTGEKRFPDVGGTVRGIPEGLRDWGQIPRRREASVPFFRARRFPIAAIMGVAMAVGVGIGLYALLQPVLRSRFSSVVGPMSAKERLLAATIGLIYAIPPATGLWVSRRRFPKKLRVDDLE